LKEGRKEEKEGGGREGREGGKKRGKEGGREESDWRGLLSTERSTQHRKLKEEGRLWSDRG
jgi:hypothetical protein